MQSTRELNSLREGETALVRSLSPCGDMRRRLQDLGLIPGTRIECVGKSPLGDPSAYLIRGAVIALRKADAASILIDEPHPAQKPALSKTFLQGSPAAE